MAAQPLPNISLNYPTYYFTLHAGGEAGGAGPSSLSSKAVASAAAADSNGSTKR
jgi:hypothetical protein